MPRKKADTLVNQQVGLRLSSHERLCAERMKQIQESIKELNKEVKSLRTNNLPDVPPLFEFGMSKPTLTTFWLTSPNAGPLEILS